ncbi:cupin domain-containing protein [Microbulbifer pacificus]|uniref:Cupin domain-containing protein n=1 Tax=Microbulbifer pacificus TaxID=407164 RepID=A0AAU0MWU8_9GAMM|nr:cupin domain-containing protein [Microbulbifer pacificus]WOX04288.1 cupin domain-containing protein [Microbulbifer pacificus]
MAAKLLRVAEGNAVREAGPVAPEKVLAGNPQQWTEHFFTNKKENFFCGIWSSDAGKWSLTYTEDEFCYIIEGEAEITDSEGVSERVVAGDAFCIPAGFSGTWETIGSVKKFYSIYEE